MIRLVCATLSLAAALVWSGCDFLTEDERGPESASITVDGDAGALVEVMTSTRFVAAAFPDGDTAQVSLIDAETFVKALPYSAEFDISQFQRFFVRVGPAEETARTVRLRVWIDGREVYNVTSEAFDSVMRFVYQYNRAKGNEEIFF
jgi:hypothetical protein